MCRHTNGDIEQSTVFPNIRLPNLPNEKNKYVLIVLGRPLFLNFKLRLCYASTLKHIHNVAYKRYVGYIQVVSHNVCKTSGDC